MSLVEHQAIRRRAPAKFRARIIDESETLRSKRDAHATQKLLDRLREHHDYNLPNPPEKWMPKVVEAEPAPEFIPLRPPSEPYWFRMMEDEPVRYPKISEIKRAACQHFKLEPAELISHRRTHSVVYPRQIAFYLCKTLTTKSFPEIGKHFGDKDHTTVLFSVNKIGRLVKTDWRVAFDVAAVEGTI